MAAGKTIVWGSQRLDTIIWTTPAHRAVRVVGFGILAGGWVSWVIVTVLGRR